MLVSHFRKAMLPTVTGDFDGDGTTDTLIQQLRLISDGSLVDSVPDPYKEEYDSVVKYFLRKSIMVAIMRASKTADTIQFGPAMGTYCLINLGDNNHDGKEEIAVVPDLPDFSNLNTCYIYSLCGRHWAELKTFAVNEGRFTSLNDTVFKMIPGYLEKNDGKWQYWDSTETFRSLVLPMCPHNSY